ncbi:unnamed protein product [Adineta steineri]|nr:unnamed protein product [Adineta steineri]
MVLAITSAHTEFACLSEFKKISSNVGTFERRLGTPIIDDFNNDNRLDIAFASFDKYGISVLRGYGNGSFRTDILSVQGQLREIKKIIVGDFNGDNQLDFVAQLKYYPEILTLLGNNDVTFRNAFHVEVCNSNSLDFALIHMDFDECFDMAFVCSDQNTVYVSFGAGLGDFTRPTILYRDDDSYPLRVAADDFNRDNYQDIAVLNRHGRNIGIFLGDGVRSFKAPTMSTIHKENYPSYFVIGDFNSDTLPDIAISYDRSYFIEVIFGYGNGSVGNSKMFQIGDKPVVDQIIVSDFNADGNLDIGFGKTGQAISLLIGNGYGDFTLQTVFPIRFSGASAWTGVGDFNGDDLVDIINVDLNSTYQDVFLNVCK